MNMMRTPTSVFSTLVLSAAYCLIPASPALADPTPAPAASATPAPTPSPSPTPGVSIGVSGSNVFVSTGASGPGLQPAEAPDFSSGSPLSPMTPYDWFTSAPMTPGNAVQSQYAFTFSQRTHHTLLSASAVAGLYIGDANALLYWGEPWSGATNPHVGIAAPFDATPYFPTHAATRDVTLVQATIPYSVQYGAADQRYQLSAGFFSLHQTDRFVFAPPAITSVTPSVGVATAETLGPGMPSLDAWNASPTALPMTGYDAFATIGAGTAEITYARIPSLFGSPARTAIASYVVDRGDNGRFSAEFAHTFTGGDPISTTTFYGQDRMLFPGPQGRLFTSTLGDQRQTLAGIRVFVHPRSGYDATVELGAGLTQSALAARPGSAQTGTYEHFGLARHFTKDADFGLDYYRVDPRYGTIILPYGFAENVWSVAWSWPGNWLKSTYQSIDNSIVAVNRQGFRAHADLTRGRYEGHISAQVWRQIQPATLSNATQEGWIEGFFLPQSDANPTLGWQRQVNLYSVWHLQRDDLVLDTVWDQSYRPAGVDPIDLVSTTYPEGVFSWQHHWNKSALGVVGYGRYGAHGTWSVTPVDAIYDVMFVGGQWDFGRGQQLLVHLRHATTHGLPSVVGGPSPNLQGTTLVVDHRISFP